MPSRKKQKTTPLTPNKVKNTSHQETSNDYAKVISEASSAINRLFELDYVELLDKRANARAMTSQFALAIKDALHIIKYASRSSRGYIRAGETYAMQGKQAEAADIYSKGLAKVSKKDPNYAKMVQGEETARLRHEQCIDMIARMPLEIAFNIFERLPIMSKGACLCVSKVWRDRLIKCRAAWNFLTASGGHEDMAVCHSVASIGKHVKSLTLACKNKALRSLYLNHMKMGHFSQISHLTLTKEMTYTVNRELTGIALWQMRSTLTRLDVDYSDCQIVLSLSAILVSAPNLIWLYYKMNAPFRKAVGDTTALIDPHPLKQLRLETQITRGEEIAAALTNCPQLRSLTLLNCEPAVLDTVVTCCPQIEYFGYNTDVHYTQLSQKDAERPDSTGLRLLEIGTAVHVAQVLPFFTRHSETLRSAYLRLNDLTEEELTLLDSWTQPTMKALSMIYCHFGEGTETVIARLLRNCPELQNAYFDYLEDIDVITRELAMADNLKKLYFGNVDRPMENELQYLFDKHVLLGAESKLTHLRFFNTTTLSDAVINGLRCFQKLNTLELRQCYDVSDKALATALLELTSLKEVKFHRVAAVNDQVILSLGSVETVRLLSLTSISDDALRKLIDDSKHLQVLEVRNCHSTKDTLKLACDKGIEVVGLTDNLNSKRNLMTTLFPQS
ncbi:hypothetical protein BDB00DRAFT_833961 [Zychaea mexicana]|uniref:uncharacterized protein n=1 Tax=Zychaea mexicana TaxID=64656 RepID=UPI0022FDD9BC|nr:uncharacterized protein BDB00DRAFT_833961 [Zychaea mexicana]KAI9491308.1 hypothetical protein BDB00DRAFT_833961 [Zychaea mexicana]